MCSSVVNEKGAIPTKEIMVCACKWAYFILYFTENQLISVFWYSKVIITKWSIYV